MKHSNFIFLYFIFLFISLNGQVTQSNEIEKGTSIQRSASFNVEEIKVRWKKAALENCTGIPCVVAPPAPSFTCGTSTITDIDLNSYSTVLIGTQCWTEENLKVTKYNDGTLIGDSTNSTWGTAVIGARTEYVASGVTGYVGTFGYLYNWYAVNDSRKLCPTGWHVPTEAEWTTLTNFLGGVSVAGGKMKETGLTLWTTPNTGATNTNGFTALPGGYRSDTGVFFEIGTKASFWSATAIPTNFAMSRWLQNTNDDVASPFSQSAIGNSVRCLRD